MPFIQVTIGAGRTAEQKDRLIRAISRAATDSLSLQTEASVRVWLVELPTTEVLVGGQTLSEKQQALTTGAAHGY
jgi:4-oxalocrotonate tautomerase